MGNSDSSDDMFVKSAQDASDKVYNSTGDNFKATEAAVAEFSKQAWYDSGSNGPEPGTSSMGGNLFDAAETLAGIFGSGNSTKKGH
jgi:hypothetical protein